MDYPTILKGVQILGLALMGAGAISLLRNTTIYFANRSWSAQALRGSKLSFAAQATGLLLFTFSSGGILALQVMLKNDFPPALLLIARAVLLSILTASIVFHLVFVRPWLQAARPEPLIKQLGPHRILGLTLSLAALTAAWIGWVLLAWPGPSAPANQVGLHVGHVALMTLLFWSVLAVPALIASGSAALLQRSEPGSADALNEMLDQADASPIFASAPRRAPQLTEIPQMEMRPVHVPAPRAPRPTIVAREELNDGYLAA